MCCWLFTTLDYIFLFIFDSGIGGRTAFHRQESRSGIKFKVALGAWSWLYTPPFACTGADITAPYFSPWFYVAFSSFSATFICVFCCFSCFYASQTIYQRFFSGYVQHVGSLNHRRLVVALFGRRIIFRMFIGCYQEFWCKYSSTLHMTFSVSFLYTLYYSWLGSARRWYLMLPRVGSHQDYCPMPSFKP